MSEKKKNKAAQQEAVTEETASAAQAGAPEQEGQPAAPAELSFEDKLKQFMSVSDSKQSELNRYMASKRGGRRRK